MAEEELYAAIRHLAAVFERRSVRHALIGGLLSANRETIDLDYIHQEWAVFAEAKPERTAWFHDAIARTVTPRP